MYGSGPTVSKPPASIAAPKYSSRIAYDTGKIAMCPIASYLLKKLGMICPLYTGHRCYVVL